MPSELGTGSDQSKVDWKRIVFILTGIILFAVVYLSPPWPDAVDPMGKHFALSHEGKGALALLSARCHLVDLRGPPHRESQALQSA